MKELWGQFLLVRHTCLLLTTLAKFPPAVRRMFMNTNCLCGKIKMLWIFLVFYHMLFYRLQSIYMLRYNKYIIKINECIYCILNFCYVFVIYFMTPTSVNKFIFVRCPPFIYLFYFIFFFSFIFISWRLITSQHCSGFGHTLT